MADQLYSGLGVRAAILTTDILAFLPVAGPPAQQADVAKLITLLNTIYAPITGGAYVLKAGDTMTGLLAIAQATANTSNLTLSGYSLTGANAQSLLSMAGTLNTSGNPSIIRLAITNTAAGATTRFLEFLGGAGGASSVFTVSMDGALFTTGAIFTTGAVTGDSVAASSNMYASSNLYIGGGVGATKMTTPSAGVLFVDTFGGGTFARIQLGGTTSSFPSIKRSAAIAQFRLADDSLFTEVECSNIITNNAGAAFSTNATLTNFAAAALGTLTNAPTAGNPTKWIAIDDNGTTRYCPTWT